MAGGSLAERHEVHQRGVVSCESEPRGDVLRAGRSTSSVSQDLRIDDLVARMYAMERFVTAWRVSRRSGSTRSTGTGTSSANRN